ncbi:MAG: hypothetical protein NTZ90_17095 [Proteobacteria bacterium]|nr:hypothetical protein [Pseudomonadota bacterium]
MNSLDDQKRSVAPKADLTVTVTATVLEREGGGVSVDTSRPSHIQVFNDDKCQGAPTKSLILKARNTVFKGWLQDLTPEYSLVMFSATNYVSGGFSIMVKCQGPIAIPGSPPHIREAVVIWAHAVEEEGMRRVRKLPGSR